jgi:hypothetical protein
VAASDYEQGREYLDQLAGWWESEGKKSRNEATTRLHLIDELLVEVLRWPKGQIDAEESHGGSSGPRLQEIAPSPSQATLQTP